MSLKPIVNGPNYQDLLAFLTQRIQSRYIKLSIAEGLEVHRLQGEIRELNRLLKLKEEINGS
jgi:hypothetical protein